jgi:hypothetical protein
VVISVDGGNIGCPKDARLGRQQPEEKAGGNGGLEQAVHYRAGDGDLACRYRTALRASDTGIKVAIDDVLGSTSAADKYGYGKTLHPKTAQRLDMTGCKQRGAG